MEQLQQVLGTLLVNASNPDLTIRNEAEMHIKKLEENLPPLLFGLASWMLNTANSLQTRLLAGLILKNTMTAKDAITRKNFTERYLNLVDDNTKNFVKNACLQLLTDPIREVRTTSAQVIAKLSLIELPRDRWPELITVLLNNMTNPQTPDDLKQSTLETLGFICEEIDPKVLSSKADLILTAVVQGMRDNNPVVKLAASRALLGALEFSKKNFEKENERDYIMKVVLASAISSDDKVRVVSYEILVKIATLYYSYLVPYIQQIFGLTLESIQKDIDLVAQQAVEFWSTLCDEEILLKEEEEEAKLNNVQPERKCHYFVKGALQYLVPVLNEALTKQKEDLDEWNVAMAAGTCLTLIANTVEDEVVQYAVPFIDTHLQSADWKYREAATLAFGSILEGPQTIIKKFILEALPILLHKHLKDEKIAVKDTTAWTLARIALYHTDAISNIPEFITPVLSSLKDEARVASNCCFAIHNLALALGDSKVDQLIPFYQPLVEGLLAASEKGDADESNLRPSAYEALNVLISVSPDPLIPFIEQLVALIIHRLNKTFEMQVVDTDDKEEQSEQQGLLCSVLHVITQRLDKSIRKYTDSIMNLIIRIFVNKSTASAQEEALMAVGAIANAIEGQFDSYMLSFTDHLYRCLKNYQDYQVCSVAVGVTGDLARALGPNILPYCDVIVTLLLEALQDPSLNRSVKPRILSCFGDIALSLGPDFERYLIVSLSMLEQASKTALSTRLEDPDDYDMIEYMNLLREGIFEAYTGILQGLRGHKGEMVLQAVQDLVHLILNVYADNFKTDEVTKAAVALLGDIGHTLGSHTRPYLCTETVFHLLEDCYSKGSGDIQQTAKWAKEVISKI